MALPGAPSRNYNSASGGIPQVTSPVEAITGNLGGLGGIISSITGSQSGALKGQYPSEYFSTLGTLLGNTGRRARGDITDLLPELQQTSAENAVYGGMSGSQAENTKLLRDLGLTRYGVENQALKDLGTIQSEIPQVRPFDPSAIINEQMAAQERADLYNSAPVPEAAYQRAMGAAGGSGRTTGGLSYNFGGGGTSRPISPITSGYAPSIPQWGTNASMPSGGGSAPWGTFQNAIAGEGPSAVEDWTKWFQQPATGQDFGGSVNYGSNDFGGGLSYGGGAPWNPLDAFSDLGSTDYASTGDNYGGDYSAGDYYDQLF